MNLHLVEIISVNESILKPLEEFFLTISVTADRVLFHPHPFTKEEAKFRSEYKGDDLYYVIIEGHSKILGYGMLRGWDQGYDTPSLGIIVSPEVRGAGLGKLFMHFLHVVARRKGAKRIRLKVYHHNRVAVSLYKKMGYVFNQREEDQLVGFIDLDKDFFSHR